MRRILIADSGSTKTTWSLKSGKKHTTIITQGLSPYFLNEEQISQVISSEVLAFTGKSMPEAIYFYGTGCSNAANARMVQNALKVSYPDAEIHVNHDLLGAAKALCGDEKGIACILGTGSNSCYYNGSKIMKNSPGLGYVLGDEGSGAYMGKKVIQYYLYKTFDEDLMDRFHNKYQVDAPAILDAVYKKPLPNRYLASYAMFLAENRGHYMIENIIEDAFNDFFFNHLYKYRETWTLPVNFVGSIAHGFRDVLQDMCGSYELQLGKILKDPMDGLLTYHT